MKKWFLILMLSILMMMASTKSFATASVQIDASLGYEGAVITGEVVPMNIEVTAVNKDINGKVKISYKLEENDSIVTSEMPIQVSMSSTKHYTLPIMIEQDFYAFNKEDFILIEVYDAQEKLIYKDVTSITKVVGKNDLAVGVLSDRYVGLTYLNLAKINKNSEASTAVSTFKMNPSYLEEPDYLEGIDVLVIDGMEEDLSAKAMDTLNMWLEQKGVLVLSTGEGLFTQESLIQTLGIKCGKQLIIDESGPLAGVKQAQLIDETFKKTQQEGIYTKSLDAGKIIFVTYSLSSKQIVENEQNVTIIEDIFQNEMPHYDYEGSFDYHRFRSLYNLLNRVPRESMPSVKLVTSIIFIYILLIGPVGYILLKKRQLTNSYWRLVSIVSVATAVIVFIAGQGVDFNKTVVNSLTFIDQRLGEQKIKSFLGVKSSDIGDVDVALDGGSIKWSGLYNNRVGLKEKLFYDDGRQHVVFKGVKKFQFANLMVENHLKFPNVVQKIILSSEGGKVLITNPFDVALSDVAVIINNTAKYVGRIPANESVSLDIDETDLKQGKSQWDSYDFYDEISADIEDSYMKNESVETFFNRLNDGYLNSANYLVLGWIEGETRQNVYVNDKEIAVVDRSFWVDTIELGASQEGEVTLPYGVLVPEAKITGATFYDNSDQVFYGYGQATFFFQLPEWLGASEIKILVDNQTDVAYQLYNYQTNIWDTLSFHNEDPEFILKSEYISETGQIQIMAINSAGNSFYRPMFSASGVVKND